MKLLLHDYDMFAVEHTDPLVERGFADAERVVAEGAGKSFEVLIIKE